LSLGADQAKKALQKTSLAFGYVTAFHLDERKDPAMQQDLIEKLLLLVPSKKTILLFMLPQALQNNHCRLLLVYTS
jgi:hypothetical protein